MESTGAKGLKLGDACPTFELPGVDRSTRNLKSYDAIRVLVIGFTCNHCPYVQAWEDRIMELQRTFASQGMQIVCINSNETQNYPQDSFDHMVERARERWFNYHYLRDEDQAVAKAFGAECTPEFFVFDQQRKLRYRGRLDDDHEHPDKVTKRYLRDAIETLLAGKQPTTPTTHAMGCSIKWEKAA